MKAKFNSSNLLWHFLAGLTLFVTALTPSSHSFQELTPGTKTQILSSGPLSAINEVPPKLSSVDQSESPKSKPELHLQAKRTLAALPMAFQRYDGRVNSRVRFISRGRNYSMFMMPDEFVLALNQGKKNAQSSNGDFPEESISELKPPVLLRMSLVGAGKNTQLTGIEELPGKSSYYIGDDPALWRSNIPSYAKVKYTNIYPGIDFVCYGNENLLEYDFVVSPHAHADDIAISFSGHEVLRLDEEGNLVISTKGGDVTLRKPFLYQDVDGMRKEVEGRYVISENCQVSFGVEEYDAALPLVIDPVLLYSTYLGAFASDFSQGIAVDNQGFLYIAGWTLAVNFPTTNDSYQPVFRGNSDIFVTKIDPVNNQIVYSTYLGGSGFDRANAIAVDALGTAYITGITASRDYPVLDYTQGSLGGGEGDKDALLTILDPTGGKLLRSTYLGGSGLDAGQSVAVDSEGNAYVTGYTTSADFPIIYGSPPFSGLSDAFVTKFVAKGFGYSMLLGGSSTDVAESIALDSNKNAYIAGYTASSDFPTTGLQPSAGGGAGGDAFVAKLDPTGINLLYSTYLGGSADDAAKSIAVDGMGNAYVAGSTASSDFPLKIPYQDSLEGPIDAFASKIDPSGSALVYSTYFGGSNEDWANAIALDAAGAAYVAGYTISTDLPVVSAIQSSSGGYFDAFVCELDPAGTSLVYSTFLGGSDDDRANAIAVDDNGRAYLTGNTYSADFPKTLDSLQPAYAGSSDAFVVELTAHIVLIAPRLMTRMGSQPDLDTSEATAITVVNLGSQPGVLTITARNSKGELLAGPGITNPVTADLPAGSQFVSLDTELFGSALADLEPVAWIEIASTISKIRGSFALLNESMSVLDEAALSSTTRTSFIFPEIDDQGTTQIHLVNPNNATATVQLNLYKPDGSMAADEVTRTVSPNGVLSESFSDLFQGILPDPSYYIRGTSDKGVVPFEYIGQAGKYIEVLNGQDSNSGSRTLYAPQYVIGGGDFASTLSIINVDSIDANTTLILFQNDGSIRSAKLPHIPPHGKIYINDQMYFLDAQGNQIEGYVQVSSSGGKLVGSIVYSDPERERFATALSLVTASAGSFMFNQTIFDPTYFTGIGLVNDVNRNVSITIRVLDNEGNLIEETEDTLDPRQQETVLLTEYFPDLFDEDHSSVYIEMIPDGPVATFAFTGPMSLASLSDLPINPVP